MVKGRYLFSSSLWKDDYDCQMRHFNNKKESKFTSISSGWQIISVSFSTRRQVFFNPLVLIRNGLQRKKIYKPVQRKYK